MTAAEIPTYPAMCEVTLSHRDELVGMFKGLSDGISEFTFANIYLFRKTHGYGLSRLESGLLIIAGDDGRGGFFMSPFGVPTEAELAGLFRKFAFMKCASVSQGEVLAGLGYAPVEDRDNFDYLYLRSELSEFPGRRFHAKKNLVNYFTSTYECEGVPLTEAKAAHALKVIAAWEAARRGADDAPAAEEAVKLMEPLALCGGVYYIGGVPVAFAIGEELNPATFVLHFAKAAPGYKGLMQFVVKSFSTLLPGRYVYINMEQDLGDPGLRKSKESYRPRAFVKKLVVSGRRGGR